MHGVRSHVDCGHVQVSNWKIYLKLRLLPMMKPEHDHYTNYIIATDETYAFVESCPFGIEHL